MHVTRLHGLVAVEIELSAVLCAAPARLSCRKHGTRARECGGKGFDVCWLPLEVLRKTDTENFARVLRFDVRTSDRATMRNGGYKVGNCNGAAS